MNQAVRNDGGFVLLDALLATALLAMAGGSIVLVANDMLDQQSKELDRSVALVAARSLVQQYVLLGSTSAVDELYRYEIVLGDPVEGTAELRQAVVVARPLVSAPAVSLDFLAPVISQ